MVSTVAPPQSPPAMVRTHDMDGVGDGVTLGVGVGEGLGVCASPRARAASATAAVAHQWRMVAILAAGRPFWCVRTFLHA
jgi:hypothetical protein